MNRCCSEPPSIGAPRFTWSMNSCSSTLRMLPLRSRGRPKPRCARPHRKRILRRDDGPGVSFSPTRDHPLTDLAVHTPRRFPQPARSGWRWSREGSAAGRSRRDAKRPSRYRGRRHADRVGRASPIPRACRRGSRIPFRSHGSRRPTARRAVTGAPAASPHPVPTRFNKTHLSANVTNHESAGHMPYQRRATGAQSRGGSSRCTRLCGSAVNRRHWRARAGPASRQLLAHEAMRRAPFFRRSSRMLLVQQLREPIPPGAWHHRGEVERARLAAG
jgi:hypothetical protein